MTGVLIKRGNLDRATHTGSMGREVVGRHHVMHLPSRGHQGLPASHQNLGESPAADFYSKPSEGAHTSEP